MTLTSLPNIILEPLIKNALKEDYGRLGDITTNAIINKNTLIFGEFNTRKNGVLSGIEIAKLIFKIVDPTIKFEILIKDGNFINAGDTIANVIGNAQSILYAERVVLNFIGHLSGIASKTNKFVMLCKNTKTRITCTRKTTPLLRSIEKYAVRCGGGYNHRFALDDAIIIKDNHILITGSISKAVILAKKYIGHLVKIEVEIDSLSQLDEAINAKVDIILLDNMNLQDIQKAVKITNSSTILEASGGITLNRVRDIAKTGVDIISSGTLTNSTTCLDIGLDFKI